MKKIALLLVLCMICLCPLGLTACSSTEGNTTTTAGTSVAESVSTAQKTTIAATTTTVAETTTPADEEQTTLADAAFDLSLLEGDDAPATWANLSWMKDISPVKLSMFVDDTGYVGGMDGWGNDDISKEITRLTGVTLDVYSAPWSGFPEHPHEKSLPLMLASSELTDFIFTSNSLDTLQNSDICYPWDELIPEYCPELFDLVDPLEVINNIASDGHFYTFKTEYKDNRTYADDRSIGSDYGKFTLSYRADILYKLGLDLFTSVEALDETLYQVQAKAAGMGLNIPFYHDPTSNNAIAWYMGCQMENLWDQETGSVQTKYRDSSWLEYYKLMNRWYRDGILPSDYLDETKAYERTYATDIFAVTSEDHRYAVVNEEWRLAGTGGRYDDFSQPVYEPVQQHLTYNGEVQVELYDYDTGKTSLFISKTCSDPARAICFVEFLKSPEGDKLTCWGIEGVHYEAEDGIWKTSLVPTTVEAMSQVGWYTWAFQRSGWSFGVRIAEVTEEEEDKYAHREEMIINDYGLAQKKLMYEGKNPAMSYARISTDDMEYEQLEKIEERWLALNAELITAESEARVEAIWSDFQHFIDVNGIAAIEERMTQRYLENLKRYQDAGYYTDIQAN